MIQRVENASVVRIILVAVAFLVSVMNAVPSFGETVATSQFSITFSGPSFHQFNGTITFDDSSFLVSGTPVNLGTAVGAMDVSGTIAVNAVEDSGTFSLFASSVTPNLLNFDASGSFICTPGSFCDFSPDASFVGQMNSLWGQVRTSLLPVLNPPTTIYTIDGFATCPTSTCTGTLSMNLISGVTTPQGNNVTITTQSTFFDPVTQQEETITLDIQFATVTFEGVTGIVPVSNVAGQVPPQFAIESGGYRAALFDVTTTAGFSAPVTICESYPDADNDGFIDGTSVLETSLSFLHNEGGVFVDRTTVRDTGNNVICGEVTSFSEFAIAVDLAAGSCTATPQPGCLTAARGVLQYNEKKPGKEKMKLQWKKVVSATTQSQFGDPVNGGTSVALCIYDDGANLVQQFSANGQACLGFPPAGECWKAKGSKGYSYKDKAHWSDGISKIDYSSGGPGKGKAGAKGSNNFSKLQTTLPTGVVSQLSGSVAPTIQLVTSDGLCISATMNQVKKDDGLQYKAQLK